MKALLVGNLQDSNIIDELRIKKIEYKTKLLSSSPENWKKTIAMVDEFDFVIWKLTETALMIACDSEYSTLFRQLIDKIKSNEHLVLLYEDNLQKKYSLLEKVTLESMVYII